MSEFFTKEASLSPPEPTVVAICNKCRGEIYAYEVYGINPSGYPTCIDCLQDDWHSMLPDEKFRIMGMIPNYGVVAPGRRRH
jgi:hypothetical protein